MIDMNQEQCGNCKFWDESAFVDANGSKATPEGMREDMGECKRYPPQVFAADPMGYEQCERRPHMPSDEWCGEFQAKAKSLPLKTKELLRHHGLKSGDFEVRMFEKYSELATEYSEEEIVRICKIPVNAKNKRSILALAIQLTHSPAKP